MVRFFYIYRNIARLIYILKIIIRAALWLFCNNIYIKNKHLFSKKGPLLIFANHPNSFLDAIIIASNYKRRVYFLARGDVFRKPIFRFLLSSLNMIPVYRLREGKENLHLNDFAFKASIKLLLKGEAVLIFIEGTCINSHELQPLKKGTARILEGVQEKGVFPAIQAIGIAYNQLYGIGKTINISISKFNFKNRIISASDRVLFNKMATSILNENIIIPSQKTNIKKTMLYYFYKPYYKLIYNWVSKKTKGTVFFDSVLFSVLLFTYPIFLGLLFLLLYFFHIPLPIILITLVSIILFSKKLTD
jgi:1-acyl-sn-glycerol-3-phosphate acyltransferase